MLDFWDIDLHALLQISFWSWLIGVLYVSVFCLSNSFYLFWRFCATASGNRYLCHVLYFLLFPLYQPILCLCNVVAAGLIFMVLEYFKEIFVSMIAHHNLVFCIWNSVLILAHSDACTFNGIFSLLYICLNLFQGFYFFPMLGIPGFHHFPGLFYFFKSMSALESPSMSFIMFTTSMFIWEIICVLIFFRTSFIYFVISAVTTLESPGGWLLNYPTSLLTGLHSASFRSVITSC